MTLLLGAYSVVVFISLESALVGFSWLKDGHLLVGLPRLRGRLPNDALLGWLVTEDWLLLLRLLAVGLSNRTSGGRVVEVLLGLLVNFTLRLTILFEP